MAEDFDYIGSYIDYAQVDKATAHLLNSLKQVKTAFDELSSMKVAIGSAESTKDFIKATREAKTASEGLVKSAEKLIDVDLKAAKIAAEKAKENAIVTKSLIDQEKELDRLIAKEEKAAKQKANDNYAGSVPYTINTGEEERLQIIQRTGDAINDLQRAELSAQQSATAWANAQKAAVEPMKQQQKSAAELRKEKEELAKIEARDKLLASQAAAALKNRVREEVAAKGSIEQRRAALIRLQVAYDNLNEAERNSPSGQRLLGIVSRLTDQVKGLEAATGRAQRNVGNYGSALNKVWGGLRQLAYFIPGLGLAGLISAIVDPIVKLVKNLDLFSSKADKAKMSQENLSKAFESSAYKDAVKNVIELTQNIELAKQGILDQDTVLKQYNSTLGKVKGSVKSLDEAEQKLTKNAKPYIDMMLYKAAAQIALDEAVKKSYEAAAIRAKAEEEFANFGDKLVASSASTSAGGMYGVSTFNADRYGESLKEDGEKRREKLAKAVDKEEKDQRAIYDGFMKKAADIKKKFGFGDPDGAELKILNTDFFDKELKSAVDHYKKLSEVNSIDLQTRVNARKEAYKKELEIINGARSAQLKAEQDKLNEIKKTATGNALINAENANAQAVKKINRESNFELKKAAEDNAADLLAIKYSYLARQKDVDEKFYKETLAHANEQDAKRLKAEQESVSRRINFLNEGRNQLLAGVARAEQDALSKLESERTKGEISEERYHKRKKQITENSARERLRINADYEKDILNVQLESAEAELKNLQTQGKDISAELLKISEIKLKIQENTNEKLLRNQEDFDRAELDILNRKKEAYKGLQAEVGNLVSALANRSYDSESQEIQRQIDLLEEKKQKDIEVANQTITNEQDKAAAITTIEARANADREQLERKQRKVEADRARFEKIAAAVRVAVDTFQKVAAVKAMAAVLLANPITAALAPLALSQVPIILATGAIATAAIAAQKIPEYRHGTKNHPGGAAVVGDGGKKEFVILPDGRGFITPNKPTTLNLPERTQVLPDAEAFLKTAFHIAATKRVEAYRDAPPGINSREITEAIKSQGKLTRMEIKNKRETHITGSHGSIVAFQRWANSQIAYVEDVIKL